MTDPKLVMTANGGDLEVQGNDIALVYGVENTPALAMFGGSDWIGNFLTDKPFDATTESLLNTVTLNSDGRLQIEKAVNADLQYLNDIEGTTWSTTVTIVGPKNVKIDVIINGELFSYLWNPFEAPLPPLYIPSALCPVLTGLMTTDIQETQISYAWDASDAALGYQYAVNTTGLPPAEGDYGATAGNFVTALGLTAGTTYYIFVRNRCSTTIFSTPVSLSADTAASAPTLPVTAGCVLDLVSSYGLVATGANVTGWLDQSGMANDASLDGASPQLLPAVFGTEPGVNFYTSSALITTGLMNGMGLPQTGNVTCFVVIDHQQPIAATDILKYCNVAVISETDAFVLAVQRPIATTELLGQLKGNVGLSQTKLPVTDNTPVVYTAIFDKVAGPGTPEIKLLQDDDATGEVVINNTNNTNTFGYYRLRIGGTLEGKIGRVIMYNRRLSIPEQTSVVNYLKTKYSIP